MVTKQTKINKNKKDFDKKLEYTMKNYIGGLFEEFDHRAALVKERHDMQFERIDSKLEDIQETLDTHTIQINSLIIDMTEVKSDIKGIKNDLKQKVDKKHFVALEQRVRHLEKK